MLSGFFTLKCLANVVYNFQVRVRHMVTKPVEEIYPKWANDEFQPELDNLIKDILDGQLNEKFWDVTSTTKSPEKRKYGVGASVIPNMGPSSKRHKGKEPDHNNDERDRVCIEISFT